MNIVTFTLLIMTCSFIACIFCFTINLLSGSNKVLSACSMLFLLQYPNIRGIYSIFLLKMLLNVCIASFFSFLTSSNHFVISLDIVFFFCILIPIYFHNLKLCKNFL